MKNNMFAKSKKNGILPSVLFGTGISFAVCLVLLLVVSIAVSGTLDPMKYAGVLAIVLVYAGSALSGYLSVKRHLSEGILCGALAGLLYAAVLMTVGLILGGGDGFSAATCGMALSYVAVSSVFGFLALPKSRTSYRKGLPYKK